MGIEILKQISLARCAKTVNFAPTPKSLSSTYLDTSYIESALDNLSVW